jgi:hypothetical protein
LGFDLNASRPFSLGHQKKSPGVIVHPRAVRATAPAAEILRVPWFNNCPANIKEPPLFISVSLIAE